MEKLIKLQALRLSYMTDLSLKLIIKVICTRVFPIHTRHLCQINFRANKGATCFLDSCIFIMLINSDNHTNVNLMKPCVFVNTGRHVTSLKQSKLSFYIQNSFNDKQAKNCGAPHEGPHPLLLALFDQRRRQQLHPTHDNQQIVINATSNSSLELWKLLIWF